MRGLAALAGASLPSRVLADVSASHSRIDLHRHYLSPRFIAEARGYRAFPPSSLYWTRAKTLEDMDRGGIAIAMLSIPTPGVFFGDARATQSLARACNDYAADMVRAFPGRFGLFAVLPMPDIEASLREIAYVLDELKGDGIGMFSSYGRAWLGDPSFAPIFEELNRRKALLFVHPTLNACCSSLVPDVPDTIVEYQTDTTRTIGSLLFSGTAARYPDVRIVFSHAGGTMPYLIERFTEYAKTPEIARRVPRGVAQELGNFFYDTAWSTNRAAMTALLDVVPVSQVVFGTDYPALGADFQVNGLAQCGLSAADLGAIYRTNALRLLPQLARAPSPAAGNG